MSAVLKTLRDATLFEIEAELARLQVEMAVADICGIEIPSEKIDVAVRLLVFKAEINCV